MEQRYRGMYFEEFEVGQTIRSPGRTVTEAVASGLAVRTGIMEGTVLAFREIISWKFSRPVFIGDTIHIIIEVEETKAIPRLGGGSLLLAVDVRNQDNETVMKGRWSVLVQSQP